MTESIYWIWLAEALGQGSKYLSYLLGVYGTPYDVFRAETESIDELSVDEKTKKGLARKNLEDAYEINDYCVSHSIGILTYENPCYPEKLKLIKDPPTVLYYIGELPNFNNVLSISIVGTRKLSEYGKGTAYKIGYELGAAGVVVVSGMALGVDSVAACGTINGGGKTVAILGCGVDIVYPRQHRVLYDQIIKHGAVISEFAPTTEVRGRNFPIRNRIISGLTSGTLIVECDMRSGAMITARHALEQGRDLFAIPGNVGNPNSNGTNSLIHEGASMVLCTDDILGAYEFYYGDKIDYLGLSYARARSDVDPDALAKMEICSKLVSKNEIRDEKPEIGNNIMRPRIQPKYKNEKGSAVQKNEGEKADKIEEAELTPEEARVLEVMPRDRAVNADYFMSRGLNASDVLGALVTLEIKGLTSSLPGGLYIRN